jgi:twinkle protein
LIVRLNDIMGKVTSLVNNPTIKTFAIGFDKLDSIYKVYLGATTYIGGQPSHGKTEWLFEMLIRLSLNYGWKHLIFSPETGTAEKIYLELICKYRSKVFRSGAFNQITEVDIIHSAAFIHAHFIIRDMTDKTPTPDEFLEEVKQIVTDEDIKTISIDPWNEMFHAYEGRQDVYLETALSDIRKFARMNLLHFFIVAHPRTLQKNREGKYEAPTAYELSGGATWYAKADSILCVFRPNEFSEALHERTWVDIIVQKAKPKEVGTKGIFEADYNWHTGRYIQRGFTETKEIESNNDLTIPF